MAAKRQKVTKEKKSQAKVALKSAKKVATKKAAPVKVAKKGANLTAAGKEKSSKSALSKAVDLMAKVKSKLAPSGKVKPVEAPVRKVTAPKAKESVKAKVANNPEIENAKAALRVQAEPKKSAKKSKKALIEISANEAVSALAAKWNTLHKKAEQIDAKPYNMRAQFEEKTAITHKVLGWGYIMTNRNDRLEVLFKDGIKYLISNYKP